MPIMVNIQLNLQEIFSNFILSFVSNSWSVGWQMILTRAERDTHLLCLRVVL